MKRLTKYMVVVMVLFGVVVLMTGCCIDDKVTGGGRFENELGDGHEKCTFGFNAHGEGCLCDGIEYKGQFQFNDHAGVKLHMAVAHLEDVSSIQYPNIYKIEGVDKKSGGEIVVYIQDNGQPGMDDGDGITVYYYGEEDLEWQGVLEGGNIVIH
jgi:hypothetical protein